MLTSYEEDNVRLDEIDAMFEIQVKRSVRDLEIRNALQNLTEEMRANACSWKYIPYTPMFELPDNLRKSDKANEVFMSEHLRGRCIDKMEGYRLIHTEYDTATGRDYSVLRCKYAIDFDSDETGRTDRTDNKKIDGQQPTTLKG